MNKEITTEELEIQTHIDFEVWKTLSKDEKEKYNKKNRELEEEWKLWLFKDEGVENNPKREQCFTVAWQEGHSGGYSEVENYFREFVELIK